MNYILVVDDEKDICDIYEMMLSRAFPLDILSAENGQKALEIIKEKGKPQIIISDLNMPNGDGFFLYQSLKENDINVPFVICSTEPGSALKKRFPDIYGFIEKPKIIQPVLDIVESLVSHSEVPPQYVPIRISLLLRWGSGGADLYMKLSDSKYVKIINADEAFIPSDADRFFAKGIQHLYVTKESSDVLVDFFQKNLSMVLESEAIPASEIAVLSLESLESVERIAKFLGWTPGVLQAAKKAVTLAVKVVSTQPNITKLIKQKLRDPSSQFSSHITLQSLLSCGFCHQLGWTSESAQMKLGLAALMHDITVDEDAYNDIHLWNEAAVDSQQKTTEVTKYRNHPTDAANLLLQIPNLPADVDQIILQHHEMKDGNGFPRGLISSRISPMASLFIIVEDLINFIGENNNIEEQIELFIKYREKRYNSGNFKKVFEVIRDNVEKSRHST